LLRLEDTDQVRKAKRQSTFNCVLTPSCAEQTC
jgi:hypothetical protein